MKLIPTKHIPLRHSALPLAMSVYQQIQDGDSISLLWDRSRTTPGLVTFSRLTLILSLLYGLGLVTIEHDRLIKRAMHVS